MAKKIKEVIPTYYNTKEISIKDLGKWLKNHKDDNTPLFIWNTKIDGHNKDFMEIFKKMYLEGKTDSEIRKKLKITTKEFFSLERAIKDVSY